MHATRMLLLLTGALAAPVALADTVYLAPERFIAQSFAQVPAVQTLWLDESTQHALREIYHRRYGLARVRYWSAGDTSTWILEDIGKEFPITAGFVLKGQRIASAQVLIYREARGDEIRFPAFLHQFAGIGLNQDQLDAEVDAISGATLSSQAMQRMAQTALLLERQHVKLAP